MSFWSNHSSIPGMPHGIKRPFPDNPFSSPCLVKWDKPVFKRYPQNGKNVCSGNLDYYEQLNKELNARIIQRYNSAMDYAMYHPEEVIIEEDNRGHYGAT